MLTDIVRSEAKVVALCVAGLAFGVWLIAIGIVVDPVRYVRQRSLGLR